MGFIFCRKDTNNPPNSQKMIKIFFLFLFRLQNVDFSV